MGIGDLEACAIGEVLKMNSTLTTLWLYIGGFLMYYDLIEIHED